MRCPNDLDSNSLSQRKQWRILMGIGAIPISRLALLASAIFLGVTRGPESPPVPPPFFKGLCPESGSQGKEVSPQPGLEAVAV